MAKGEPWPEVPSLPDNQCSQATLPENILIITHKFLESPVEEDTKVEVMPYFSNATGLATMVCKNVAADMDNDKKILRRYQ